MVVGSPGQIIKADPEEVSKGEQSVIRRRAFSGFVFSPCDFGHAEECRRLFLSKAASLAKAADTGRKSRHLQTVSASEQIVNRYAEDIRYLCECFKVRLTNPGFISLIMPGSHAEGGGHLSLRHKEGSLSF